MIMVNDFFLVEAAVRSLEDNPVFNAGHGACLNKAGEIEMDAIISDGSELHVICHDDHTMPSLWLV